MEEQGRSPHDLRKMLQQHNLQCIGGFEAHVQVFGDEGSRRRNHDLHLENARLLDALGGGVLVVGTDGPPSPSVVALEAIGRILHHLADDLPETVSLAVEFNWSPIVRSLRSAHLVVRAADHPRVGILFDPAHFHCTPTRLEDLSAEIVPHILHVHMNDMRDKPGDLSDCNADRLLPGEGILPLGEMVDRLERFGYRGHFSLELFNRDIWNLPAQEAASLGHAAMRRFCAS
jgi:2-keto-myo-inositol isomerase